MPGIGSSIDGPNCTRQHEILSFVVAARLGERSLSLARSFSDCLSSFLFPHIIVVFLAQE
jgi:hypothetical protein